MSQNAVWTQMFGPVRGWSGGPPGITILGNLNK